MDSQTLLTAARRWRAEHMIKSYVHRFSDSWLHSALMIAVVVVATIAMVKAIEVGVTVLQLDKVVVTGQPSR
ncbi:hypothetical protein [Pelomonas sp. SE-A7]|uniref:hypothetical protein n=1 Tax=Pelomonas sp. SE-A7 TaxID=3054953 RepID=UPI00259CFC39|nr:hypothetical protein [Pelomonas sp. SE-A7]MDM4764619.1 hypothetical protein [Pelomonas sp. SE-A7]